MRMLSWIFYLVLIATLSTGYFFTCTEKGLQKGISLFSDALPGKLSIKSVSGKLFSDFTLKNVRYTTPDKTIFLSTIHLKWNPDGLIIKKIIIDNLQVGDVAINITSHTTSDSTVDLTWLHYFLIKRFSLNHFTCQYNQAKFDFQGELNQEWNAAWQANIPDLKMLSPALSGALIGTGKISGQPFFPIITSEIKATKLILAKQKIDEMTGKILLNFTPYSNSSIALIIHNAEINKQKFKKLAINADGNIIRKKRALLIDLKMLFAEHYALAAYVEFPRFTEFSDFTQPIDAKINLTSDHLDLLTNYISEISHPEGMLEGTFFVTGSISEPDIALKITLKNGQCAIPSLGINLQNINLQGDSNQDKQLIFDGTFSSGRGAGKIKGDVALSDATFPISCNIEGDHLQLVNLSEYKMTASPNVKLHFENNILQIQGKLSIPEAQITPKNFSNVVTLPSEVIFVDKPTNEIALPFDMDLQIHLQLGDKIHIAYDNLLTDLKGELEITEHPNGSATAVGELYTTDGTYKAYGKVLKIQDGRLIYSGGTLINPGLNIKAVKAVKIVSVGGKSNFSESTPLIPVYDGTDSAFVGIQITGTFENRTVTLFSNPPGLSQNDILSYLVFGFPQSQVSDQQNRVLLSAATALNFGGKDKFTNVTDALQNTLGLTELNVGSMEVFNPASGKVSSTTAFVIGKKLAPNLYANYSIGIFEPVSTLNLRYQLSKHFAIQSETGTIGKGADLLYSIERD